MSLIAAITALGLATATVFAQNSSPTEPCALLSALATDKDTMFFPADTTLACLRSVPLAKAGNLLQLSGLRVFLEFQSDLEYLKDPVVGRIYPGVDLLAGVDKLTSLLEDDSYDNEFDFQMDVFKLFSSAYDGHLAYVPDILDVFVFSRVQSEELRDEVADYFSLISVTTDNNDLPDVYAYSDVAALVDLDQFDYTPSPLTQINGEDVLSWLNSYASQNGRSQDPDANYNALFLNVPTLAYQGVETSHFAVSRFFQGNKTNLAFANNTNRDVMTRAQFLANKTLEGLTDGANFFDRFCTQNLTETVLTQTATLVNETQEVPFDPSSPADNSPPHLAYPTPVIISSDNSVAGYFSETYDYLAILAISSFSTTSETEFEDVVRDFLEMASNDDRTSLVIDLRGNGGGSIFLAYDLFRQLFPREAPYGAGNYRANELHDFTGRLASDNIAQLRAAYPDLAKSGADGVVLNSFNYREPLTVDNEAFTSWQELFGPHMGIWSVVAGGRPQAGPMQGVGGVKGSQVQGMFVLYSIITTIISTAPLTDQLGFIAKFGNNVIESTTQALSRAAAGSSLFIQASLNFRNNIRQGDESETPLQHIYEAADCRFFYTAEMYVDQSAVWDKAYDATWGSMECVGGSTEHPSSVTGGRNITAGPPGVARNFFGGNQTMYMGEIFNSTTSQGNNTSSGGDGDGGDGNNEDSKDENGGNMLSTPWLMALAVTLLTSLLVL
ncbi:hypothetical protein D6C83_07401 [Aureobasidium pullulans]|uniref:Uncharacterized protein n=1 Tax=Aureobasidium pullulans TaxID=5580 RepID=A0A4T0B6L9_AURPU|nr:hypothetical protein D6C83_07401 [Aureobasidium pullulans]